MASFVFYSAQTLSLGLGLIELSSGLNQPFDATIKLVSRSETELEGLRVGLASNADFDRIGAVRLPFLNDLSFEIITPDNGKPYIRVTSTKPIREPFVDFILEANWPAGRLLREYTVLLDPPTVTTERAAPVQAPTTNRAPSAVPPAPRAAAPRRQQESSSGGGIIQPTTTASVTNTSDLVFGPVGANDTLWNIADSMRPADGISVQQMMIALLKENPEAFAGNNINNLKRGSTLSIEDASVITELSHKQAISETGRQYQDWLAAKEARRAARGQVAKQEAGAESASAESEAAGVGSSSSGDASSLEGGLRLLADDALEDGSTVGGVAEVDGVGGQIGELREELELTSFAAEAAREQNAELRDRMTGLEEQIAGMQRALQLKDDTLTQLQQKLGESAEAVSNESGGDGAGIIETLPLESEQEAEIIEPEVDDSGAAIDEAAGEMAEELEVELDVAESDPGVVDNVVNNATGIASSIKEKVTALYDDFSLDSVKEAVQPENILERYRDNPLIFRIVSGVIAVLVILGLIVRRRRVAAAEQFDEYAAPIMAKDDEDIDAVEEDEFGIGSADGEIADVLGEADVYISYQRYDKAETILQHAIDNEPNRVDLKVKLLNVYHAAKNVPAFVASADKFYPMLGEDRVVWSNINDMGLELAPDYHLFNGDGGAAEFDRVEGFDELSELDDIDDSDVDIENDDYADIDLEMEVLTADGDVWDDDDSGDAANDDVDAEGGEKSSEYNTSNVEEAAENAEERNDEASKGREDELDLDLELDMSDDATDAAIEETSEAPAVLDDIAESAEASAESNDAMPSADDLSSLNDDVSAIDVTSETNGASAEGLSLLERAMDNAEKHPELTDFNEKFGSPNVGDSIGEPLGTYNADEGGESEGYDPSLFAGVDVVSTKLDLAKAYIDMGDQDGARSILSEVVAEGTDEQQSEAQELIDQL